MMSRLGGAVEDPASAAQGKPSRQTGEQSSGTRRPHEHPYAKAGSGLGAAPPDLLDKLRMSAGTA